MVHKMDLRPDKEALLNELMSTPEEREALLAELGPRERVFDIQQDPYNHMMRMVFSRWKPFILQAIAADDGTYFSKFFKQLPITQKVLSQNLKDMTNDGLIYRDIIPEVPPRVVYRLTNQGKSLIPLLNLIYDWGWNDMQRKNMPVDALGEMWHGYREKEEDTMFHPYCNSTPDHHE